MRVLIGKVFLVMSKILQLSSCALTLSQVLPKFLLYARAELGYAPQTLIKYEDCMRQVIKMSGDRPVDAYTKDDVLQLKGAMLAKSHSASRQVGILSAFKSLLQYCREHEQLEVLDSKLIVVPKRPRREVVFLTVAEVEQFVSAIRLTNLDDRISMPGLRFRALVETLLGSGMRIGEALALNRDQIDFENYEARIIGKGNKERVVFFTERAMLWIHAYLSGRTDAHPALFVTEGARSRLSRDDVWRPFTRYRILAGLRKRVTPHLLRHTAATQLLFNGCPIGHIKEILGHERLETTCRYYLGLDRRAAKQAHQKYLVYGLAERQAELNPVVGAGFHPASRTADTAPAPAALPGYPHPSSIVPSSEYHDVRPIP